ncbi:MAG: NAAT family transporter [Pseudomonadota bacterium]|nr:NAAT family transporter [Pseudomonadota bacterium]
MNEAVHAFLLSFPALFSIINPLSGAFIFREVTASRSHEERNRLAGRVAVYAFVVMVVALSCGSFVLAFFGITLAALRVAGGVVVALSAWELLSTPERRDARRQQSAPAEGADEIAMFPLTIPFTTGPGTISVAVALGTVHPPLFNGLGWFFLGVTIAAAALAGVIWGLYRLADRVSRLLGPTGSRTATRLFAFLLLCIGVQILIRGVQDVLGPLIAGHGSH